MPAGCDFKCKNKNCDYFDTGFSFTGPWPMGRIDEIIKSEQVQKIPELVGKLKQLKEIGRDHICITFPNVDNIETTYYRVQLWNQQEKCLWQYDILKDIDLENSLSNANLPKECPKTGEEMISYQTAIRDGIDCPSCGVKLTQNRWFTQEK